MKLFQMSRIASNIGKRLSADITLLRSIISGKIPITYEEPIKTPRLADIIDEAKKEVAYQAINFSNHEAFLSSHVRKSQEVNQLFGKVLRNLLNGQENVEPLSLTILLLSKTAGLASDFEDSEMDSQILHTQRIVAEIIAMLRIYTLFHQTVVNFKHTGTSKSELETSSQLFFDNKLALLVGDYFLSTLLRKSSELKDQEVFELISLAISYIAQSGYIGDRNDENVPVPSPPKQQQCSTNDVFLEDCESLKFFDKNDILGHPEREWTYRNLMETGIPLGNCCQAALKLAGHSEEIQKLGHTFGRNMALAFQLTADLKPFQQKELPKNTALNLISAPVLFHINFDPSLYEEIQKHIETTGDVNFSKIHRLVMYGSGIDKARELLIKHKKKALDVIDNFPKSNVNVLLQSLILEL